MTKFKRIAAYHLANGSYYSDGHGTTTDVSRESHAVATERPREGRNFRVFSYIIALKIVFCQIGQITLTSSRYRTTEFMFIE